MIRRSYTIACGDAFKAFTLHQNEDYLFFDIETTGLSPKDSSLYLIGCMYKSGDGAVLVQLLCENCNEEAALIEEFLKLQEQHPKLVHYNGSTFDVPFIKAKAAQHGIPFPEDIPELDIYIKLKPFKKLLGLSSMRQKAIESYLKISRRDIYDGGELIDVYLKYVARRSLDNLTGDSAHGNPDISTGGTSTDKHEIPTDTSCRSTLDAELSECGYHIGATEQFSEYTGLRLLGNASANELQQVLLLHNYEDVYNMSLIASLLPLPAFFGGAFTPAGSEISEDGQSMFLTVIPECDSVIDLIRPCFKMSSSYEGCFSQPVSINLPGAAHFELSLGFSDQNLIIRVPVYQKELKLFLPDYKNYYYLPEEDYCVHKSLGSLLSADTAVKCTAANCYTKKEGRFLPSPAKKGGNLSKMTYLYQDSYRDTCRFIPVETLSDNMELQKEYALELLQALL